MFISYIEQSIVTLLFHPRIIKSMKPYCTHTSLATYEYVKFAGKQNNNLHNCTKLKDWIHQKGLHIVAQNWGVIDATETNILAVDVVLARPQKEISDKCCLIMCTVVIDCRDSVEDTQKAYQHTYDVHQTLNHDYSIRCRSVLLRIDEGKTLSEVWV